MGGWPGVMEGRVLAPGAWVIPGSEVQPWKRTETITEERMAGPTRSQEEVSSVQAQKQHPHTNTRPGAEGSAACLKEVRTAGAGNCNAASSEEEHL